jgi:hypothetical protein
MPIPAYAKVQTMTTTDKRRRIEEIHNLNHALLVEQVQLQLEVEEEEGRSESLHAKWCRAWQAHDMAECDRLLALEYPSQEAK